MRLTTMSFEVFPLFNIHSRRPGRHRMRAGEKNPKRFFFEKCVSLQLWNMCCCKVSYPGHLHLRSLEDI